MPHLPRSSESQLFPLPILPHPDISVGGRLAHFVEQWGELTHNKWVLSIIQDGFRVPFSSTPPLSVLMPESIFPLLREEIAELLQKWAVERVQDPGTPGFLFPAVSCCEKTKTKKNRKVMSSNRSFSAKPIHKETTIQDGDSQVSTTIDIGQSLGCLLRPDRCLPTHSNSSAIQEISSVHV